MSTTETYVNDAVRAAQIEAQAARMMRNSRNDLSPGMGHADVEAAFVLMELSRTPVVFAHPQ